MYRNREGTDSAVGTHADPVRTGPTVELLNGNARSAGTPRAWLLAQVVHRSDNRKETPMKTLTTLLAGVVLAVLAGCNTIEGAGKDIRATGAAVERTADDAKPK
jgi:predicted small secreted protein